MAIEKKQLRFGAMWQYDTCGGKGDDENGFSSNSDEENYMYLDSNQTGGKLLDYFDSFSSSTDGSDSAQSDGGSIASDVDDWLALGSGRDTPTMFGSDVWSDSGTSDAGASDAETSDAETSDQENQAKILSLRSLDEFRRDPVTALRQAISELGPRKRSAAAAGDGNLMSHLERQAEGLRARLSAVLAEQQMQSQPTYAPPGPSAAPPLDFGSIIVKEEVKEEGPRHVHIPVFSTEHHLMSHLERQAEGLRPIASLARAAPQPLFAPVVHVLASASESVTPAVPCSLDDPCPFCCINGGEDSDVPAGKTRLRRDRKQPRKLQKLGSFWKSYGYTGPKYCQLCSEVLRDHLFRRIPNSANCTRAAPCHECSKILRYFPAETVVEQEALYEKVEAKLNDNKAKIQARSRDQSKKRRRVDSIKPPTKKLALLLGMSAAFVGACLVLGGTAPAKDASEPDAGGRGPVQTGFCLDGVAQATDPADRQQAASWTDTNGRLWLFGGASGCLGGEDRDCGTEADTSAGGTMNDLWTGKPPRQEDGEPIGERFLQFRGEEGKPWPRHRAQAMTWPTADSNVMVMFGGYAAADAPMNDLWTFRFQFDSTFGWRQARLGESLDGRAQVDSAYVVKEYADIRDVAIDAPTVNTWPLARGAGSLTEMASGKAMLFGGRTTVQVEGDKPITCDTNDLWTLRLIADPSNQDLKEYTPAFAWEYQGPYLTAGVITASPYGYIDNVGQIMPIAESGSNGDWILQEQWPAARSGHAAWGSAAGWLFVFGGRNRAGLLGDLWCHQPAGLRIPALVPALTPGPGDGNSDGATNRQLFQGDSSFYGNPGYRAGFVSIGDSFYGDLGQTARGFDSSVAKRAWTLLRLQGVPANPLIDTQFVELARGRTHCVRVGTCDENSPALRAFDFRARTLFDTPGGPPRGPSSGPGESWTASDTPDELSTFSAAAWLALATDRMNPTFSKREAFDVATRSLAWIPGHDINGNSSWEANHSSSDQLNSSYDWKAPAYPPARHSAMAWAAGDYAYLLGGAVRQSNLSDGNLGSARTLWRFPMDTAAERPEWENLVLESECGAARASGGLMAGSTILDVKQPWADPSHKLAAAEADAPFGTGLGGGSAWTPPSPPWGDRDDDIIMMQDGVAIPIGVSAHSDTGTAGGGVGMVTVHGGGRREDGASAHCGLEGRRWLLEQRPLAEAFESLKALRNGDSRTQHAGSAEGDGLSPPPISGDGAPISSRVTGYSRVTGRVAGYTPLIPLSPPEASRGPHST
jgi:hypothetical protein